MTLESNFARRTPLEETGDGARVSRFLAWLPLALILAGIVFYCGRYLANPAIWLDEAYLALNIFSRTYDRLFFPLDHQQAAPPLFLLATKALVIEFGGHEFVFRFIPLVASVSSLPALYLALRGRVSAPALCMALAIMAASGPAIRYASEFKQYATDTLACVLLFWTALRLRDEMSVSRAAVFGLFGAVAVWISFTALFVLVAFTAALALETRADRKRLAFVLIPVPIWASNFFAYFFAYGRLTNRDTLQRWWNHAFAPFPPLSSADANWYLQTVFSVFEEPLGITATGIGLLLFGIGAAAVYRRDKTLCTMLLFPWAATLAASALHVYPFTGRFLLFVAPLAAATMGEGLAVLQRTVRSRALTAFVVAILLIEPWGRAAHGLLQPDPAQGVRPAYDRVARRIQPEDTLYLYHWAAFPFLYEMHKRGDSFEYTVGATSRADWSYYLTELGQLRGKGRVWFVFAETPPSLGAGEEQFFIITLDRLGTPLEKTRFAQSSVFLYDL